MPTEEHNFVLVSGYVTGPPRGLVESFPSGFTDVVVKTLHLGSIKLRYVPTCEFVNLSLTQSRDTDGIVY